MLSKVIDIEIQQMATKDWDVFKDLIGNAALKRAMVVVLRKRGLSYGQISQKLSINKISAYRIYCRWHTAQTVNATATVKRKLR